jgi:phosphohistidine phosphatase
MKNIYLMRHAKSSWSEPGLADHDRGLNRRGKRDAPRMGRALAARLPPCVVASSSARRARLTLAGLCEGWPGLDEMPHRIDAGLYTFSADELAQWITGQDDALTSLFIIGHNPAMTVLINTLAGKPALDNLPTAAFAHLSADIEHWAELQAGCGQLLDVLFPRTLEED